MAFWGPFNLIPPWLYNLLKFPHTHKTWNIFSCMLSLAPLNYTISRYHVVEFLGRFYIFSRIFPHVHYTYVYIRNCIAFDYLQSNDIRNEMGNSSLAICRLYSSLDPYDIKHLFVRAERSGKKEFFISQRCCVALILYHQTVYTRL